ncbi:MAG: hypothetical protein V1781_03670 [Bacteroidota bacterium]
MIKNEINVTITDTMVNNCINGISNARTAIMGVLIKSLTPQQQKEMFKMSKGSLQFVQEDYNFAQNPVLKAAEINLSEWNNDITGVTQLLKILDVLEPFYNDVEDMLKVIGSEAMNTAQYNYRFLRYRGAEGQPTAQSAYERLRSLRWEKPPRQKTPPSV